MRSSKRRRGGLALLVLCAGLVVAEMAVLSAAQIGGSSTVTINTNQYLSLTARYCDNLEALAQLLENAQATYLPILPPYSNIGFTAPVSLTPFNFTNLPAGFDLEHLTAEQVHGVAIYPLTIAQDPITRETVFLNGQGDVLYTLAPPAGYDPVAWLLAWRPNLAASLAAASSTNAWLLLHDPARIQVALKLIAEDDVVPYLLAQAVARQDTQQQSSAVTLTSGGMNTPYSPPATLTILGISMDTNGANLTVGYPEELSNYHHFILGSTNLLTTNWVVLGNDLYVTGANPYLWTDTNALNTNTGMNACLAMNSSIPEPPGGSSTNGSTNAIAYYDPQFYRALAVDPLDDSDSDGLPDWWEIKYFGSRTGGSASGDENGDGVNNLTEFARGRNPLAGTVPDTNGVINLCVYTPMQ